jgi:carboxyl-terminal processing protease
MHRVLLAFLCCLLIPALGTSLTADEAIDESREQYELMKLFVESFQQIESNYVTEVNRRELIEAAIQGMMRHLDQYSLYLPPVGTDQFNQKMEQEFGGIGVHVDARGDRLTVISPIPGSPAAEAGMLPGDVILEVDGTSLNGVALPDAIQMIQGPAGRPVSLKVLHAGEGEEPTDVAVVREVIQVPTVHGFRVTKDKQWDFMYSNDEKIGYIHMSHFGRLSGNEMRTTVQALVDEGLKALILDLRSNPGGLLDVAIEICDMFLNEGNIVSVKGRNVADQVWDAKESETFPEFPIAILVNRYSASASEVVSAALQDNDRAVVVGERTWGKGSVQNIIRLEDGDSQLKLTMASYHRPSGVNIHRTGNAGEEDDWGVTPNDGYEIRFDGPQLLKWQRSQVRKNALREDSSESDEEFSDTQLEKAVEYLRGAIAAD